MPATRRQLAGRTGRYLVSLSFCTLAVHGLIADVQAQVSNDLKVRVTRLEPLQSARMLEFSAEIRRAAGGEAYLRESVQDRDGTTLQRIDSWQQNAAIPPGTALELVQNAERHPELRAVGLRMLADSQEKLDLKLIAELIESPNQMLRLEAVRTLQTWHGDDAADLLRTIAADVDSPTTLRAEAVLGLSTHAATSAPTRKLLLQLAKGADVTVQSDSLRSLRGLAVLHPEVGHSMSELVKQLMQARRPLSGDKLELAEQLALVYGNEGRNRLPKQLLQAVKESRPANGGEWLKTVKQDGDIAAGRRVFFHTKGVHCSQCHAMTGRGGLIASDLSNVGRSMDRKLLVESIVEPSKLIPPPYVTWTVVTHEGKVYSGLMQDHVFQKTRLVTDQGMLVEIPDKLIEHRTPQAVSLMPAKLVDQMTTAEFRNLLTFLAGSK